MHQIIYQLHGASPQTHWGSLQRFPDPLAVFRGLLLKERAGKDGSEGEGERRGREGKEEEGKAEEGRGEEGRGQFVSCHGKKKKEKSAPMAKPTSKSYLLKQRHMKPLSTKAVTFQKLIYTIRYR